MIIVGIGTHGRLAMKCAAIVGSLVEPDHFIQVECMAPLTPKERKQVEDHPRLVREADKLALVIRTISSRRRFTAKSELAELLKCHPRTVQRYIEALEKAGFYVEHCGSVGRGDFAGYRLLLWHE